MKVQGEHLFKGTPQQVWELFRDTEVMAAALPGTRKMELVAENKYQAVMNVRVGPVAGEFSGELLISNENFPHSYTMSVEGRGKPGFLKGVGDVILKEQGEIQTLMEYVGEVQIGGRLAAVGQRLIDTVSKSIISAAFETLDKVLAERVAAAEENREVSYEKASESDYAAAVAKDLLSKQWVRWAMVIGIVVVIGLILLFTLM
jgi:carbon monoxide dehydrogenase subunit G